VKNAYVSDGIDIALSDLEHLDEKFLDSETEVKIGKLTDDLFSIFLFSHEHNLLEVMLLQYDDKSISFNVLGRKKFENGKLKLKIFSYIGKLY